MPTMLRNLKISEVSSVDRGAGEGVQILLMKRADDAEDYFKRTFTDEQREAAAASGEAMEDGSFPIKTTLITRSTHSAAPRTRRRPRRTSSRAPSRSAAPT